MRCVKQLLLLALFGVLVTHGGVSVAQAQSVGTTVDTLPSPDRDARIAESSSQQNSKSITLVVQDSSVGYILRELGKLSNYQVIFNGADSAFQKRISVRIVNARVMDAFAAALQGTDLVAKLAPTGKTILIRTESPAKKKGSPKGKIIGVVIDSVTRKAIPGVTILITGANAGANTATSTGDDGSFQLTHIPFGTHVLSARLLGYHTRTVSIRVDSGMVTRVPITLFQASRTLTEVVTTATGSQRRAEISNDVVTIDADKLIQVAPVRNVTDLLVAAQVPGMIVTPTSGEPGAPSRIRFGGVGSISQNNDPVVIVDGIWIKSSFSDSSIARRVSTGGSGYLPSRLDAIDPASIETIEIVRGPAAATLYGPDAANGVIKITTKRGRAGPARWDFQYARDEQVALKNKPLMYLGFGKALGSSAAMQCGIYQIVDGECTHDSLVALDPNGPLLMNEGHGVTNRLTMAVSGGVNQMQYSVTGTAQDQLSVRRISGANLVRFRQLGIPVSGQFRTPGKLSDRSLSTNLTVTPMPSLNVMVNFSGTQRNSRENNLNITSLNITLNPLDTILTLRRNAEVLQLRSYTTLTQGMLSVLTNWNPRTWWSGNMTVGLDRGYTRENSEGRRRGCMDGICTIDPQTKSVADQQYSIYTTRAQSTFSPNLGWASRFLTIRPGMSFDLRREIRTSSGAGVTSQETTGSISIPSTTALAGIGLNTNIRLFDKLSFDPAIRRDFGSSKNLRNNAKTYPRFGTSWLVSDESFFPKNPWVTSLRLRMAFGYAAVQPDLGAIRGRYVKQNTVVNGEVIPTVVFAAVGNKNLQPERSVEIESGFDADLIGDRATLTVTYANKQNKNTLINRILPPSSGADGERQENVARVVNHRADFQLIARVIERTNVTARITTSLSVYDNRIKTLGNGVSPFGQSEQRYVAGYPVNALWGRPIVGMHDLNDNGILEEDEVFVGDTTVYRGSPLPRYTAGYNIEIGLLGMITLNAAINYKGRYMQNRNARPFAFGGLRGDWDPTASLAEQALAKVIAFTNADMQSLSEVRLQSASVTMNVPQHLVRKFRAKTLQISLQGSNLGLWTQYRGRDPGVNSTPIGERITDNGSSIAEPRGFSLQVRLGY